MHFETILTASSDAAFLARLRLSQSLAGEVDPATLDTVRLGATELITNAVRHGGLATGAKIELLVAGVDRRIIHVEVVQPSPARGVHILEGTRTGAGGYGLRIVDTIADRWGVQEDEPGCVWFELNVSG